MRFSLEQEEETILKFEVVHCPEEEKLSLMKEIAERMKNIREQMEENGVKSGSNQENPSISFLQMD